MPDDDQVGALVMGGPYDLLEQVPRTREALESAWERWTLDQRRTVLRLVLDSVVVSKAEQRAAGSTPVG